MTIASTARIGVNPWKRLNAPPVLRLSRSSTSVADDRQRPVGELRDRPGLRGLVERHDADDDRAGEPPAVRAGA